MTTSHTPSPHLIRTVLKLPISKSSLWFSARAKPKPTARNIRVRVVIRVNTKLTAHMSNLKHVMAARFTSGALTKPPIYTRRLFFFFFKKGIFRAKSAYIFWWLSSVKYRSLAMWKPSSDTYWRKRSTTPTRLKLQEEPRDRLGGEKNNNRILNSQTLICLEKEVSAVTKWEFG